MRKAGSRKERKCIVIRGLENDGKGIEKEMEKF